MLVPALMVNGPGTLRVKTGGTTASAKLVEAVRDPDVPVIVTVLVAKTAALLAVRVNAEPPVVGLGDQEAVTPAGRPLAARVTGPENPYCEMTPMEVVIVPPCATLTLEGPERVNAGVWI